MDSQPVPSAGAVPALLPRGNGTDFAATSPAADDSRLRPHLLPVDPEVARARVTEAVGSIRRDLGQNRRSRAELWRALGAGQ